jgi:hypothetical protein
MKIEIKPTPCYQVQIDEGEPLYYYTLSEVIQAIGPHVHVAAKAGRAIDIAAYPGIAADDRMRILDHAVKIETAARRAKENLKAG